MKNITLYILLFALCPLFLVAQSPDTMWTQTYGGPSGDYGRSVQQTSDGGYIITGYADYPGAYDVFVVKTDSFGNTSWTKTYGGDFAEEGLSITETADSGYVAAGATHSFGAGQYDLYLIKMDANGDSMWTKVYGDIYMDYAYAIQQLANGELIMVGMWQDTIMSSSVWLIKTDQSGDSIWSKKYGGMSYDYGTDIQLSDDGGFIITGVTASYGAGGEDVYLIKTDSLGDTLWTKTYGGPMDDWGQSVQQTSDGGYIVTGTTESFGAGAGDIYLIKTDQFGDTMWTKTYGDIAADYGSSVLQNTNGEYIILGSTEHSGGGNMDFYLLKTDVDGDTLWTRTYGGMDWDWGYSVKQTSDDGYIVVGTTYSFGAGNSDVWLLKIAPDTFGIVEQTPTIVRKNIIIPTILSGPLLLPEDKICRVFDIIGRVVVPERIKLGIYFIEIDGQITGKVVKVR